MSLEGKWKCIKTENLEEFLIKNGFLTNNQCKDRNGKVYIPKTVENLLIEKTQKIEKTGDKKWKIKSKYNWLVKHEIEATEEEEYLDDYLLGGEYNCILRSDTGNPNKLIQEARSKDNSNKLTIITREIIEDIMLTVSYTLKNNIYQY